jgi:nitrile hydratase
MGGMHGFGPVPIEVNEPVFHEEWEGRMYGIYVTSRVQGAGRPDIESIPPAQYLKYSYYEKWLHAKVESMIRLGIIDRHEFEARTAAIAKSENAMAESVIDPERVQARLERIKTPDPRTGEPTGEPLFTTGDIVRARNFHPPGHTRLPRYIRGHVGTVQQLWGWYRFEDQDPPFVDSERVEPVYSVRFEGEELWGEQAEPNSPVYIDMWESHLDSPDSRSNGE